jgi:hypothetical protein
MTTTTTTRLPQFGTYGNYSGNYGSHCLYFEIGSLTIYFSYQTIVAFRSPETGLIVTMNDWGPTTGKHLNRIDGGDKSSRYARPAFETLLRETLERNGLTE